MSESDREERIRQRAYERYQQRGADDGRDFDDWLEAEREDKEQFDSTKHPPVDIPEAPHRDDAGTPPGSTGEAAPGRGLVREDVGGDASADGEPKTPQEKEDKINEAAEESFPASDAPAWRGGSAN